MLLGVHDSIAIATKILLFFAICTDPTIGAREIDAME